MITKIFYRTRIFPTLVLCLSLLGIFSAVSAEPARSTFTVSNTNMSGAGSLNEAIYQANNHTGFDIIDFNIPFSDPGYVASSDSFVIYLTSPLYDLSDPDGVWIDGNTQLTAAIDDRPNIEINAVSWPTAPHVLMIPNSSNNNIIQGLTLRSSSGDVLKIDSSSNWITHCVIHSSSNGNGISIMVNASGNYITDNYIFNNNGDGINIESSDDNFILRNKIGIEPDYVTGDKPNLDDGISCLGSSGNEIRENIINDNLGDGIQCILCNENEIQNNNLSGNLGNGLYCSACTENIIEDNIIGLSNFDYTAYGNNNYGIRMENSSTFNGIFGNFISGNAWDGIRLIGSGTTGNHLYSNVIGFGYYGGFIPNGQHGIGIYNGAHENYIGERLTMSEANYIGGNIWSGVAVDGNFLGKNYIHNNYILSNQWYGVHVKDNWANEIGFNVIHFNGLHGIHAGVRIEGTTGVSNMIVSNSIHGNTGLGIELVGGGNAGIAAPLILSADCQTVSGTTCPNCHVEIFSDDTDEGEFIEWFTVADSSGYFTVTSPGGCFRGPNITATTTSGLNTSQFSLPAVGVCRLLYLPIIFK